MDKLLEYSRETVANILNVILSYLDYFDFCEIYPHLPYSDMLFPYICCLNGNIRMNVSDYHLKMTTILNIYEFRECMNRQLQLANPRELTIEGFDCNININHMSRLESLTLCYIPIKQANILQCTNIKKLVLYEARAININNLSNLEELCILNTDIHYSQYRSCKKLKKLTIHSNREVCTFINYPNLTELDISYVTCTPNCFINCKSLTSLKMYRIIMNLKDLNELQNLRSLHAVECKLYTEHINNCVNLTHLNITGNKIKNLNTFKNLLTLDYMNSDITENDIKECTKLKYLNVSSNKVIRNLNALVNLETLICRNTMINQDDIVNLVNLTRLDVKNCVNINNIDLSHYSKLKLLITNDFIKVDDKNYVVV